MISKKSRSEFKNHLIFAFSSSASDDDGALNPTFIGDTGIIRGYNITTSTPRYKL